MDSTGVCQTMWGSVQSSKEHANLASTKIMISEAHKKFGHISNATIKQAIANGNIKGIELDDSSKADFCKTCAKAKVI